MADGVEDQTSVADRVKAWLKDQGRTAFKPTVPDSHLADAMKYGLGASIMQQQAESRLHRPGHGHIHQVWLDEAMHIDPAAVRAALNGGLNNKSKPKTLADFSDAELIMEMIGRGFAAMKIPDGEVLK